MRHLTLPLILPLLLSGPPLLAGTQHYQAPIEAVTWQASSQKLHCSLSHDIPLYGRATFAQSAGRELGFSMSVKRTASRDSDRARLRSLPPEWMYHVDSLDLGEVAVHRGDTPFRLGEPLARRMLAELQKGMFPTLSYRDWADAQDRVSVALPGVNFRAALDEFITCLAKLPIYDFADYKDTLLHFAFGKAQLSSEAKKRLDAIAIYLHTDPAVSKIIVAGHTDDVGRYRANDKLADRRSRAIRDYLVAKGAPADKLELHAYGERRPVYTNTTDEGRARNRRASVTLVRK